MSDTNQHKNKLDNSEYAASNTLHYIAPAAVDAADEARLYHYMKALRLRAEIEQSGLEISVPTKGWNPAGGADGKGAYETNNKNRVDITVFFQLIASLNEHGN